MSSALYPLVPPFVAAVILFSRIFMDFGSKLGLVDKPNERSSHTRVIPRVGGIALFAPYLILGAGLFLNGFENLTLGVPYWCGLSAIVILGTVDDRLDLSSSLKFLIQFGVATFYILQSGNYVDNLYGLFGFGAIPEWLGITPLCEERSFGLSTSPSLYPKSMRSLAAKITKAINGGTRG